MEELWTIKKPFDTLLLKYWPKESLEQLIASLSRQSQTEIAEALCPVRSNKTDFYRDDIVRVILEEWYHASNLCNSGMYCTNIILHSNGMKCVTAAAIRKRLHQDFDINLGTLEDFGFQKSIVKKLKIHTTRNDLGVLLIHCPPSNDIDQVHNKLYSHVMKVLYKHFYLYTAPLYENYLNEHAEEVRMFVGNQIFRNSDCIVILVDDEMINKWQSDDYSDHMLKALGWDIKLRVLVIGVSPLSKDVVTSICDSMQKIPWPIYYDQLIMAPSGGLVTIIKKACKLEFKNSLMKYFHRATVVVSGLESIDQRK